MPTSAPEMPVTLTDAGRLLLRGIDHGDGVAADQGGDLRRRWRRRMISNNAAEAAKIERKFIVKLPVFRDPLGTNTAGTGGAGETDAARRK